MPAIVRKGLDTHIGHASPTPNPFHKTSYSSGSSNVFANGAGDVRKGDVGGARKTHDWYEKANKMCEHNAYNMFTQSKSYTWEDVFSE